MVWHPLCQNAGMSTTVLIVDDHASFRSFARALLQAEGYRGIGEAGDGSSGIEEIRLLRPDLVLLDVQLPDIDGFEVLTDRRDLPIGHGWRQPWVIQAKESAQF